MQGLHLDHRSQLGLRAIAEHPGRALEQLIAPLDLVRMHVELLRQLDQRLLSNDRSIMPLLRGKSIYPGCSVSAATSTGTGSHLSDSSLLNDDLAERIA